ncbi:hypothetical protein EDC04DRAFT_2897491 [Pisolithus marmoratus]|nr:hypothetical protein EDC04DRAFT_2897491 [Pisolithus marmoratus]
MEAIRVFANNLKKKVDKSKWYSFLTPLPAHFLQLEYIELCLFLHLHHVKDVYANSKKSQETQNARLRSAAHSMCKTRLVGSQGVSSDELDTGLEGHKVYQKISPAWHRSGTDQFMVKSPGGIYLAALSMRMWWHPLGLPLNCYKDSWLVCLLPSERKKLDAQANKQYNFESRKTENVIPPPTGATFLEMQVDDGDGSDTSTELEGDDTQGEDSMDEDFTVQLAVMTSDQDLEMLCGG